MTKNNNKDKKFGKSKNKNKRKKLNKKLEPVVEEYLSGNLLEEETITFITLLGLPEDCRRMKLHT